MRADINKINYIEDVEGYHIVTEFSRFPVETFQKQQEANEIYFGLSYRLRFKRFNEEGEIV